MPLKRVETESLLKSFLLFFLSLNLLSGVIFYFLYDDARHHLNESLFMEMQLCSLDLKCDRFTIDFEDAAGKQLHTLLRKNDTLFAYFPVPRSQSYVMRFSFEAGDYRHALGEIRRELMWLYLGVALLIVLLSLLFSFYALHPLRRSLKLTEEFVRDILHDVNTPLSALRLNLGMLRRETGENARVARMEEGVERILALQGNLRSYLGEHALQRETIALEELLAERTAWFEKLYPDIRFTLETAPLGVTANREALTRIIDNLLDNAAKYNVRNGSVTVTLDSAAKRLRIADTGRGIKEPQRIFERFYKEHERGMGIGLHIVRKLCDEMGISIAVSSEPGRGSRFELSLEALTLR
jgi:two-component system OmpR family sensor kinase